MSMRIFYLINKKSGYIACESEMQDEEACKKNEWTKKFSSANLEWVTEMEKNRILETLQNPNHIPPYNPDNDWLDTD